jgi:hypothetical protein
MTIVASKMWLNLPSHLKPKTSSCIANSTWGKDGWVGWHGLGSGAGAELRAMHTV